MIVRDTKKLITSAKVMICVYPEPSVAVTIASTHHCTRVWVWSKPTGP